MEWNYFLLILINSLISQSRAYVEIIHDKKNWSEARNVCVNRGGRLAHLEELEPDTCTDKSINVWLNVRLTPWIAKMGCYNGGKLVTNHTDDVLKCYRFCKSAPFGYKDYWCQCEKENKVKLVTANSPCLNGDFNTYRWLYDKSNVDIIDDDITKNCISAQCTVNGTILKADNCSLKKIAYCQKGGSTFTDAEMDTQANSEKKCNAEGKKDHLISNQICSSFSTGNSSQEFWTGIQRYKYTESLTDIKNCVYVRCENGNVPVENTGDCGQQIEGFACFFNGTSTTVNTEQPSPESSLESTLISSTEPILLHVESTSKNFVGSSLNTRSTEANNISTTSNNTADKNKTETAHSKSKSVYSTTTWNSYSRSHNMNTEKSSPNSSFLPTLVTSPEPIPLHFESTSEKLESFTDEASTTSTSTDIIESSTTADTTVFTENKNINRKTTWNSYSTSSTLNTESTSEISEYSSEDASKTSESSSQNTTSIKTNNIDKSTLAYNTTVTNKPETNHSASEIIYSKTTWKSYTRRHTSKTGNSILPTSVISETTSDKDRVSAFMNTSSKLPIFSNTYMSSTAHTSDLNNKSGTELNGRKKISSTVTRPQNDSSSDQLNTGLIVGISVSILSLLVLIIGVFGIRRLRNQRAWKESSLDFSSPINTKKETKVIENDSTYPVVSANDDDKSFRPTDTTSNSNTNKPNNPYAVVVKKAVSNKSDTTSNGKETKSNNADDPYAIVVKIPEKNQNQDEQTSLDIPDSTYDSTHQPRSISDNESGNISDTSTGHCDDSDPS